MSRRREVASPGEIVLSTGETLPADDFFGISEPESAFSTQLTAKEAQGPLTQLFLQEFLSACFDRGESLRNPDLCFLCRSLTFQGLVKGFYAHENLKTLACSGSLYCPLCKLITAAVGHPGWWGDQKPLWNDKIFVILVRDKHEFERYPERLEVRVMRPHEEAEELRSQDYPYGVPEIRFVRDLIVCIDPKYPLASELKIRPTRKRGDCEENIELVKQWIKNCEENHQAYQCCTDEENLPLPSRVIDVGLSDGSQEPKLFISNTVRGKWIALSYTWGGINFVKLLKRNVELFQQRLPLGLMPQVFRDAIKLTRDLGLRYLWIDALCIIQDSAEDFQVQSAQMPEIYNRAYLTVAAASNGSPLESMFKRSDYEFYKGQDALPVNLNLGLDGILQFTTKRPYHPVTGFDSNLPSTFDFTGKRGWCTQEQVLSRRFLKFHPTEMSFTCGKEILLESYYEQNPLWQLKQRGPFGTDIDRFQDADGAWKNHLFAAVPVSSEPGDFQNPNRDLVMQAREEEWEQGKRKFYSNTTPQFSNSEKLNEVWHNIVQEYTNRQLTKVNDKLVAIAGIAKYVDSNKSLRDDYHAGLFKSMLPYALMWKIPRQPRPYDEWPYERETNYIAPSWSWASMKGGPLDFERCWKYLKEPSLCEIVSFESTPAWNDRYSAVKGGKIVIRGQGTTALVNTQNDMLCFPDSTRGYTGYGHRHLDEMPKRETIVICLELFSRQGILLVEVAERKGIYKRVGIYSCNGAYRPEEPDLKKDYTII